MTDYLEKRPTYVAIDSVGKNTRPKLNIVPRCIQMLIVLIYKWFLELLYVFEDPSIRSDIRLNGQPGHAMLLVMTLERFNSDREAVDQARTTLSLPPAWRSKNTMEKYYSSAASSEGTLSLSPCVYTSAADVASAKR